MDIKTITNYCLSKNNAIEDYPFGPDVLAIKLSGKMFALISARGNKLSISLKCDPILAEDFRQRYPTIKPGYHLNKTHWNTIQVDDSIPKNELYWMIDHSYTLVFKSLTKVEKESLSL